MEPWKLTPSRRRALTLTGPVPEEVTLVQGDSLYIPKAELPPSLRNALLRLAAFQNPEFYKAQAMRLPTFDKPRIISCAEDCTAHLALPRGCLEEALKLFKAAGVRTLLQDERFQGIPIHHAFYGTLRSDQEAAAAAMLQHDTGVLAATTAFGKTVLGAWLIARRGVNTLILVHRLQLLEQWIERLSGFLNVKPNEI